MYKRSATASSNSSILDLNGTDASVNMMKSGVATSASKVKLTNSSIITCWADAIDNDKLSKMTIAPFYTRISMPAEGQKDDVNQRFVALLYAVIERQFLNYQLNAVKIICQIASSSFRDTFSQTTTSPEDKSPVSRVVSFLEVMVKKYEDVPLEDFTFQRFSSLQEELLGLAGDNGTSNRQLRSDFVEFAVSFYKKNVEGLIARTDPVEFLRKFEKDKALMISSWVKMTVKVLVVKQEKIQILCDQSWNKDVKTKVDKTVILVEHTDTALLHIAYDCSPERLFRFCIQAKALSAEGVISKSMLETSERLTKENQILNDKTKHPCYLAREKTEKLTDSLMKTIISLKKVMEDSATQWIQTLDYVSNHIIPSVTIKGKDAFVTSISKQTESLKAMMKFINVNEEKEIPSAENKSETKAEEYSLMQIPQVQHEKPQFMLPNKQAEKEFIQQQQQPIVPPPFPLSVHKPQSTPPLWQSQTAKSLIPWLHTDLSKSQNFLRPAQMEETKAEQPKQEQWWNRLLSSSSSPPAVKMFQSQKVNEQKKAGAKYETQTQLSKNSQLKSSLQTSLNNLPEVQELDDQSASSLLRSNEENTSAWTLKIKIDSFRRNIVQRECALCCDSLLSNQFWYARCSHVYCLKCLKSHVTARLNDGKRDFCEFTCCMCELPLEPKELYDMFLPEQKKKIDEYYINRMLNFRCPNVSCGMQSYIREKDTALKESFATTCCDTSVCSKCKGKFHGAKSCPSQTQGIIDSVNVFRSTQDSDMSKLFRFCPACQTVAFKDLGCNHVTCLTCKCEFCFQCSAPRKPVIGHGNHYHRLGCPDFSEFVNPKTKQKVDNEYDQKKCKDCEMTKQPCKRPDSFENFNNQMKEKFGEDLFNAFPDNFIL